MFTVLWCYLRNNGFKVDGVDYHVAADLTGQANHIGVTIEADIIKQKLPENNGGYNAVEGYGKTEQARLRRRSPPTTRSTSPAGRSRTATWARSGLINSGGESKGAGDLADAVRTAVINKRGRWHRADLGRKAFQRPMAEGIELLNAIQDVYLDRRSPSPDRLGRVHGRRARVPPVVRAPGTDRLRTDRCHRRVQPARWPTSVTFGWQRALGRGVVTDTVRRYRCRDVGRPSSRIDRVVIRFAGDSGDGMQLTGDRFTSASALVGNDLATLPEFPAEIRAPAGTRRRGLGVPGPHLRPRHHHARRRARRAGGDEPGGAQGRRSAARAGRHAHRQQRHVRRAQPRRRPATPTTRSTTTASTGYRLTRCR